MERKESIGKDATSKETVEDLEEDENSTSENHDDDLPSPDGEFDDEDEVKDAGPV
jgi:hypothetical protein